MKKMVNYHEQLMNKIVTTSGTEVSLVGEKHILLKPSIYTLEKNNITNQTGDIYYKIIEKTFSFKKEKIIVDINNNPLLIIKNGSSSSSIEIFSILNSRKVIASITKVNSFTDAEKYIIIYYNQTSEKNETLSMNCATSYRSCGIFNGVEEEGASLICKISERKAKSFFNSKSRFNIEISSGNDGLFMSALALCLNELKYQNYLEDIDD
ncbi:hypothetical protein BCR36DRAFT_36201 [Piromyces finnis]|uniref:DUF567-domain-containing protein n=1 Tax=Piromyces finnis TaxID=1754191 RepID=A0A1Y1VBV9_9FUNG|nr:hypothetical protein BCR36DRAFT_36201 [Piromyces finnis]|eukprot:ORX52248.1 hypothetical protein BCR36DRAFT_36201 [Piromyces finnis]